MDDERFDAWPLGRDLLLAIAPKMERAGHRREWLPYLERGLAQSRARRDVRAEADICLELGVLHRLLNERDKARDRFSTSASRYAELGDAKRQAFALNRLAYVAVLDESLEEATRLVQQAFDLCGEDEGIRAFLLLDAGKNCTKAEKLVRGN